MQKWILTGVMSGFLMLTGSLALAQDVQPSGNALPKANMQVKHKPPIPSFEQRLNLTPLSDEELSQITARGLGPTMPFPFQPFLFLQSAFPTHNFLAGTHSNTVQIQGQFFPFRR